MEIVNETVDKIFDLNKEESKMKDEITVNTQLINITKGINIDYSYQLIPLKKKDHLVSSLKVKPSIDKKRLIWWLECPVSISSFNDEKSFILAKLKMVDDVINKYDGLLFNFSEEQIPIIFEKKKTTSVKSMGFDIWGLKDKLSEPELSAFYKFVKNNDFSNTQNEFAVIKETVVFGYEPEIQFQLQLSALQEKHFHEPSEVREWMRAFMHSNYSDLGEQTSYQKKVKAKFFLRIPKYDFLRPMMNQDPVIRDIYLSSFENSIVRNYYITKIPDIDVYQNMAIEMELRTNIINSDIKIPQRLASADVSNAYFSLICCVLNGQYRKLQIPINRETFDVFDPLLVLSILVAMVIYPKNVLRKIDRILMRNYLYYHLLQHVNQKLITFSFNDDSSFRQGDEDAISLTTFNVNEPNGCKFGTKLMTFLGEDYDNCWSEGGVDRTEMIPNKFAKFYPGRKIWYPVIYLNENGSNISEYVMSARLIEFKDLLNSGSQFSDFIFRDKNKSQNRALVVLINTLLKSITRLHQLMWKTSMIIASLSSNPFCSPIGFSGEDAYNNIIIKGEPMRVFGASIGAIPISLDPDSVLIKQSNNKDMYMWALNEFISIQELAERIQYYTKELKQPLFNTADRINAVFYSRRFPSAFDGLLKETWLYAKDFIIKFKPFTDDENSEYLYYKNLATEFISQFKTTSFGYVPKFHYIAFLLKVPKYDTIYEKIYVINKKGLLIHKEYKDDEDIRFDIVEDKIKNEIDKSVESGVPKLIIYNIPLKFQLKEFSDMEKFNLDEHPLSYSEKGGIVYSSITTYARQYNLEWSNIDSSNSFLYTGPPRFMVDIEDLYFITLPLDGLENYFSKINTYTQQLEFVESFPIFQTSLYRNLYAE